jgi:hypothetical protein
MKQALHRAGQLTAVVMSLAFWVHQVRAEVPPLDSQAQKASATDIVIGDVRKVQASERPAPDGLDTVYHLEIRVVAPEKGERWRKGDTLTASCWRIKARPDSWEGPSGQWFIPRAGARIRAYLNGQDLLSPNGIDVVIAHPFDLPESGREQAQGGRQDSWPPAILAGCVCLAVGFAAGRWCGPKRSQSNVP